MPSIDIFVHDLSATGVVRNAVAIARHMAETGSHVRIVTCRADGAFVDHVENLSIVVLPEDRRGATSRSKELVRVIPKLRDHLKTSPADILLSAGNHAHLICWAASRGLAQPRRVYRISNDLQHGGEDGGIAGQLKAVFRRATMRLLASDAAALVLVSEKLAREEVFHSAEQNGKLTVIRNGVDVAQVRRKMVEPCAMDWPQDQIPVALAIGRFVKQKNFPRLLQAVALANATRPLRLVILGEGNAAQESALRQQAEELGIAQRVIFAGVVGNPFPLMRRATVLVMPSLWEGASNVLLEALACGTPIVASFTAGNAAEVLDDGRYGLLVDPENPQDIADALLRQCDEATRIPPGNRAEECDINITLARYEALFCRIADEIGAR